MTFTTRDALSRELFDIVRDRQRKRTRREQARAFAGKFWKGLIGGATHWLIDGWMFMLAVGLVHHEWAHAVPTVGFWWAVLIAGLLRSALNPAPSSAKSPGGPS